MTKHLITFFLFSLFSSGLLAQEKGDFILGGSFNINLLNEGENEDYNSFGISPSFGTMLNDKLALNVSLNFERIKTENNFIYTGNQVDLVNQYISLGLSPYLVFYKKLNNKFYNTSTIGLGFGSFFSDEGDINFLNIFSSYSNGFIYKLTDKVALSATLFSFRVDYFALTKDSRDRSYILDFNLTFIFNTPRIGILLYLPTKKNL